MCLPLCCLCNLKRELVWNSEGEKATLFNERKGELLLCILREKDGVERKAGMLLKKSECERELLLMFILRTSELYHLCILRARKSYWY